MSKKFPFEDVDEEYLSEAQAKVILEDFILRNSIVPNGWEDEMSEEMKIEHLKGIKFKALHRRDRIDAAHDGSSGRWHP